MAQLALFDSAETVLVDDERGRIVYTPQFVAADLARAWFDELRGAVDWRAERRMMYDREIDVPRLQDWLVETLNREGLTATAAARHSSFNLLDRQRLLNWQRRLYGAIQSAQAILLPTKETALHG